MEWLSTSPHLLSEAKTNPAFKTNKQLFEQLPNTTVPQPWHSKIVFEQCQKEIDDMTDCDLFPMPILCKDMTVDFLFYGTHDKDIVPSSDHTKKNTNPATINKGLNANVDDNFSPSSDTTLVSSSVIQHSITSTNQQTYSPPPPSSHQAAIAQAVS